MNTWPYYKTVVVWLFHRDDSRQQDWTLNIYWALLHAPGGAPWATSMVSVHFFPMFNGLISDQWWPANSRLHCIQQSHTELLEEFWSVLANYWTLNVCLPGTSPTLFTKVVVWRSMGSLMFNRLIIDGSEAGSPIPDITGPTNPTRELLNFISKLLNFERLSPSTLLLVFFTRDVVWRSISGSYSRFLS